MFNPFSEEERLQIMLACCYAAVQQGGFQHLALRDIIDPPHNWFDALLARQVAIHILATQFGVPKRRIVTMQARQRTSVSFAVHAVDRRLETEAFADAYRRMAALAESLFEQELEKAAA
ncbi:MULTISPECIES: hypothetical protein [Brucella]|uniref:Uncharacterized protein n=1 Tax=Brucella intermedia M86 TaxID=1234597 RepID=M5JZZ5_9HYPH|nr:MULTISPECIES: hypothetical protein [Brucella]ELT49096.1 hypothetical protein D584_11227 [Brucella intermedia M86]KAB2752303.1 hypothetical protein F9L05_04105 [Brucella anthropi]MCR5941664.1 hypothetical protein [Ochrobactrum sp. XJ1]